MAVLEARAGLVGEGMAKAGKQDLEMMDPGLNGCKHKTAKPPNSESKGAPTTPATEARGGVRIQKHYLQANWPSLLIHSRDSGLTT